jgi:general secretion pathway protein B
VSLILDALRRAERERSLGHAPRIEDITQALNPPRRRPLWPVVAGGGVTLALVVGLALWLWPRSGAVPDADAAAPPAVLPTSATVAVAAAPAPAPLPAPTTPPTQVAAATVEVATMDDLVPVDESEEEVVEDEPVDEPIEEDVMVEEEPLEEDPVEPFDASEQMADEDVEDDIVEDEPEVAQPAPATPPPAVRIAPQPSARPAPTAPASVEPSQPYQAARPGAADGPPKKLREMPSTFRGDFPKFKLDVHVFDKQPAKRFVMIDMQRYREGERLSGGAQIVEIVPQGIVFEFRGQKVLYTLNRS